MNRLIIVFGKFISKFFRLFNLGDGSTWPGHIALGVNKNFVRDVLSLSKTKIIVVAGTNGKTTTAALLKSALKKNGKKAFQNKSGANLLNGVASSLIMHSDLSGKLTHDFAIFEIDENALPQVLKECNPDYLILLNLFRDQLDRYGEVNSIIDKWKSGVEKLSTETTLILSADDPQIAYLGKNTKARKLYFGLEIRNNESKNIQHTADSGYCPECSEKLVYNQIFFSHLGNWYCKNCGLTRPKVEINNFSAFPMSGVYNKYNTLASVLVLRLVGIQDSDIEKAFSEFKPAFGRQEIIRYKNKNVQIFLSKNPTSFNQSYLTISELGAKVLLMVLNDRIPDGRDISWIWDIDLPGLDNYRSIIISGDRAYDMALRITYADCKNFKVFEELNDAINYGINQTENNETFFILPTYSAMLDTRKILTGKKIL